MKCASSFTFSRQSRVFNVTQTQFRRITPEEIGALIIDHLRQSAEQKYGNQMKQLVISVPAEFDQLQRNATSDAAQLVGMLEAISKSLCIYNARFLDLILTSALIVRHGSATGDQ